MRTIVVIAHDIRSTHNVGSLLRTCEGLGVSAMYLTGYTPYPSTTDDDRLPHIPGGVFIDMVDYMESFDKIEGLERQGVQIIPSHDQRVLDTGVFG